MKYISNICSFLTATIALLLLVPKSTYAHVKWFVDTEDVIISKHGITPFYYLTSKEVLIWSAISILVVVIFSILDRIIPNPTALFQYANKKERTINYIAQAILGAYLVTVTVIWKVILIPDFAISTPLTKVLAVIQICAGLLFIFNKRVRLASILTAVLYVYMGYMTDPISVAENALLLSLLIYFFIKHSPHNSKWKYVNNASIEIVRIGTGITLITLAFTEKLMYPELGLNFLDVHQWNFMQNFGLSWFNNTLFVLSTGFAEMIFGIIFILGYLTRINTVAIASFFAASVVTMFIQFGAWEVEDLVVYSAAILFIFYGYGHTRFFEVVHPSSWWRRKHIGNLFRG